MLRSSPSIRPGFSAGDYKDLQQFPLVKIGFTVGNLHDTRSLAAKIASAEIAKSQHKIIEDLHLDDTIAANLSSGWGCETVTKNNVR